MLVRLRCKRYCARLAYALIAGAAPAISGSFSLMSAEKVIIAKCGDAKDDSRDSGSWGGGRETVIDHLVDPRLVQPVNAHPPLERRGHVGRPCHTSVSEVTTGRS